MTVVLVIVFVGVVIAAIQGGWLDQLIKTFVNQLFRALPQALGLG